MIMQNAKNMTQKERVLYYLKTRGKITSFQAWSELGVARLASRVSDLKKDGWVIVSERVVVKNRFSEDTIVASYRMGDEIDCISFGLFGNRKNRETLKNWQPQCYKKEV